MTNPQPNDTVLIAFIGTLDNGTIFYEVTQDNPIQVTLGNNDLPPTVEQAISRLAVGETVKIRVPPEEGYGARQKELLQTIDNQQMVDSLKPKPGMILSLHADIDNAQGKVPATVMEVKGSQVTVDYNHPLAGHHLNYQVTLLEIVNSPQ